MMMKKCLIMLMLIAAMVTVTACGSSKPTEPMTAASDAVIEITNADELIKNGDAYLGKTILYRGTSEQITSGGRTVNLVFMSQVDANGNERDVAFEVRYDGEWPVSGITVEVTGQLVKEDNMMIIKADTVKGIGVSVHTH